MSAVYAIDLEELKTWIGFGVAGNFAGHLDQAGEARDFLNVKAASGAPKGIFPFYVPGAESFLGAYPLSSTSIARPVTGGNLQIEPEVALTCRLEYDYDGKVESIYPYAFGAYNDCSIRREGAKKISEKKNWGPNSKGIASRFLELDTLEESGVTADYRLACYLKRGSSVAEYGIDSGLTGYSYYGKKLLDWIVSKLRTQSGSPGNPLENVGEYLADANNPKHAIVSIGATRYTKFGSSTYLDLNDTVIVAVYNSSKYSKQDIANFAVEGIFPDEEISLLQQTVV